MKRVPSSKKYQSIVQSLVIATLSTGCIQQTWGQQNEPTLAPPLELVPADIVVNSTTNDAQSTALPLDSEAEEQIEGATPLMQGPVHEAFAERINTEEEEPLVINREPPKLIDEQPPEYRPDGENIE